MKEETDKIVYVPVSVKRAANEIYMLANLSAEQLSLNKIIEALTPLSDLLKEKEAEVNELREALEKLYEISYDLFGGENAPDNGEIPELKKAKTILNKHSK